MQIGPFLDSAFVPLHPRTMDQHRPQGGRALTRRASQLSMLLLSTLLASALGVLTKAGGHVERTTIAAPSSTSGTTSARHVAMVRVSH